MIFYEDNELVFNKRYTKVILSTLKFKFQADEFFTFDIDDFIDTTFTDYVIYVDITVLYHVNLSNNYHSIVGVHYTHIYPYLKLIKKNSLSQLNSCIDLVIYDHPNKNYRFTVIYCLISNFFNYRLNIFTQLNELQVLRSTINLYLSIIWSERECWDLFGIFFINHTDLRRILTDYGFKGHPLRRDFPLTGFYEVSYNDLQQHVTYDLVELTQEFRSFNINYKKKWN